MRSKDMPIFLKSTNSYCSAENEDLIVHFRIYTNLYVPSEVEEHIRQYREEKKVKTFTLSVLCIQTYTNTYTYI